MLVLKINPIVVFVARIRNSISKKMIDLMMFFREDQH